MELEADFFDYSKVRSDVQRRTTNTSTWLDGNSTQLVSATTLSLSVPLEVQVSPAQFAFM